MQDFDIELLKEFRRQVHETGKGTFRDPRWAYEVTIVPTRLASMITVVDTGKRWWGRELVKHEHKREDESSVISNGPVETAMMLLDMAIERGIPFK